MFVAASTASRIERAEAAMMRSMIRALPRSVVDAFAHDLGGGVATYVRPQSPLNKLIGVGIDAAPDAEQLEAIELAFHRHGEPVRAEISTLADPSTYELLMSRGYRLVGFENVLVRPLDAIAEPPASPILIERTTDSSLATFRDTTIDAAARPDDTGVVVDQYSREMIAGAVDDALHTPDFMRYLAYRDGEVAGAASMSVQGDIAALNGSATLVAHRRRGVQAALLARRLVDARSAGATIAIITTAPGTQSQANVMKLGFALAYPRAVLVR